MLKPLAALAAVITLVASAHAQTGDQVGRVPASYAWAVFKHSCLKLNPDHKSLMRGAKDSEYITATASELRGLGSPILTPGLVSVSGFKVATLAGWLNLAIQTFSPESGRTVGCAIEWFGVNRGSPVPLITAAFGPPASTSLNHATWSDAPGPWGKVRLSYAAWGGIFTLSADAE